MSATKRKAADLPGEPQRGQRQPQISCDSCRKRKLKCDRGEPCSSCAVRGLPCHRQPSVRRVAGDQSHGSLSTNEEVLRRLQALEDAVFNSETSRHQPQNFHGPLAITPVSSTTVDEHSQVVKAKTSREPSTHDGVRDFHEPSDTFKFGISPAITLDRLSPFQDAASTPHDTSAARGEISMMPREQASALLQDFVDHVFAFLPVIHAPTTRTLVCEFYDQLSRGAPVRAQVAALILSIGAISAHLWQPGAVRSSRFSSAAEAAQLSQLWAQWAAEILTRTQASEDVTLEGTQAWILLSFAVMNAEGSASYFRFLHHCGLMAARELSMHLVDSPRAERVDDRVTREVKRRIWWHLAATDWMLGFIGGPAEGTYTVNPRHMIVKYPRNLNDNDLATWDDSMTAPLNLPTEMSFYLQRIRIGEITRAILDARPPGTFDVDIPEDYNTVLSLDRLFDEAFADMPPFFQIRGPLEPEKLDSTQLQGAVLQLCLLSRRARLHRPFLLHQTTNPRYQKSHDICLEATRTTVSISVAIIEASLNVARRNAARRQTTATNVNEPRQGPLSRLSAHRFSHIINHLFMACTILAFYAGSASDSSSSARESGDGRGERIDPATVHAELANACRVLAVLGAESPVAARLLRNLVGLLRRYQVQGVGGEEMLERLEEKERRDRDGTGKGPAGQPEALGEGAVLVDGEGGLNHPVAGDGVIVDFDGLWDDLIMGSADDFTQLFADLDYQIGMA